MLTAAANLLEEGDLRPVSTIAKEITGRRPTPGTVWRWCKKGTRAGLLPAVPLYGSWHTTRAAFRAWLQAGTDAALSPRVPDVDDATLAAAGLLGAE